MRFLKKFKIKVLALCLVFLLVSTIGCQDVANYNAASSDNSVVLSEDNADADEGAANFDDLSSGNKKEKKSKNKKKKSKNKKKKSSFSLDDIPDYDGEAVVVVNKNKPYFKKKQLKKKSYEKYKSLDSLGRATKAVACIGSDLMPTEERGEIGQIKPTGWHTVKYAGVDGGYLYNRCHLIAYCLTAENANEKNLITGTRYMNVQGMLPFEEKVANYLDNNPNNHVMYRVRAIYDGDNLLASGVLMEAYSVEDSGKGICFCVFAYNVQPNITIDYATGDSSGPKFTGSSSSSSSSKFNSSSLSNEKGTYILNTNTMKFHRPDCASVAQMADHNKKTYKGKRKKLIKMGYSPCQNCNP